MYGKFLRFIFHIYTLGSRIRGKQTNFELAKKNAQDNTGYEHQNFVADESKLMVMTFEEQKIHLYLAELNNSAPVIPPHFDSHNPPNPPNPPKFDWLSLQGAKERWISDDFHIIMDWAERTIRPPIKLGMKKNQNYFLDFVDKFKGFHQVVHH